jgi:hypothetical protein
MHDELHSRRCLAEAIISAVQNLRDEAGQDDHGFRIEMQGNGALPLADLYLNTGLQTCTCGAYQMDEVRAVYVNNPHEAQGMASRYLRRGVISPEQYLRLARSTQRMEVNR